MKKHILSLASLLALGTVSAQVRVVNSSANTSVTNSPAFIDASSNTTVNGSTNVGKGLIFPRVDLSAMTAFPSVTAGIPNSFPTRFDGMIVYNTASSGTAGIGSTSGTLTPGFWYYENKSATNTGGTWKSLGISSSVNLYNTDGSLTGNRVITSSKKSLTITTPDVASLPPNGLLRLGGGFDYSGQTNQTLLSLAPGVFSIDNPSVVGGRFIVTNTNRVGINNPSPEASLDITLTDASAAIPALRVKSQSGGGNIGLQCLTGTNEAFQTLNFNGFYDNVSNNEVRYNTYRNRWRVGVDQRTGPDRDQFFVDLFNGTGIIRPMIISSGGNIGVNNSNPQTSLDVLANSGLPAFRVQSPAGAGNIAMQCLPGSNEAFQTLNFNGYYDSTSNADVRYNTYRNRWRVGVDQRSGPDRDQFFVDLFNGTTLTTPMIIASNGSIGVNNSNPQTSLDVLANSGLPAFRVKSPAGAGNIAMQCLPGSDEAFQTLNFNGYYDSTSNADVRYNTYRNRWRVGVDQRSGPDRDQFFVDLFNGTGIIRPMIISSGGNIGVNNSDPQTSLDVLANSGLPAFRVKSPAGAGNIAMQCLPGSNEAFQTINFNGYYDSTSNADVRYNTYRSRWRIGVDQRGGPDRDQFFVDLFNGSTLTTPMIIASNGNTTFSGTVITPRVQGPSDRRFKKDITPIYNATEKLNQLNGYTYTWRDKKEFPGQTLGEGKDMGVIAQEVEKVFPDAVQTNKDGYKSVNYNALIPVLIESLKEAHREIKELKEEMKKKEK